MCEIRFWWRKNTHWAVGTQGLHTSRVVVLNAAARLSLQVSGFLDQVDDLRVPANAGRKLGAQMNEVILEKIGLVLQGEQTEQQDRNRAAESAAHSQSGGQSRSSAAGCTWRSHKYLYSLVPAGGDRVKQVDLSVFIRKRFCFMGLRILIKGGIQCIVTFKAVLLHQLLYCSQLLSLLHLTLNISLLSPGR